MCTLVQCSVMVGAWDESLEPLMSFGLPPRGARHADAAAVDKSGAEARLGRLVGQGREGGALVVLGGVSV